MGASCEDWGIGDVGDRGPRGGRAGALTSTAGNECGCCAAPYGLYGIGGAALTSIAFMAYGEGDGVVVGYCGRGSATLGVEVGSDGSGGTPFGAFALG